MMIIEIIAKLGINDTELEIKTWSSVSRHACCNLSVSQLVRIYWSAVIITGLKNNGKKLITDSLYSYRATISHAATM